MVQMTNFGRFRPESEISEVRKSPAMMGIDVKAEIEDDLEEEFGSVTKRSKILASPVHMQQFGTGVNESGLLGLRLRKSPSFLDLIQMKLSQDMAAKSRAMKNTDLKDETKIDNRVNSAPLMAEKLKASNFSASLLKIGTWEYVSTYEGDLVAKCYFAKHKIVWEVLEGGLKSKIEIQWSDIKALKAVCPEDGPGTLEVVLARQPQFFRETNPQPRKHTLWQAASDFTNGQASIYRRHFLQCPQGSLDKHFEKLVQCDPRLFALSQQPEIILENPYFERCSVFDGQNEPESRSPSAIGSYVSTMPAAFQDVPLAYTSPLISRTDAGDFSQVAPTQSDGSGTVSQLNMHNSVQSNIWDQFRDPIIQPSMPVSVLLNNIGSYISERFNSGSVALTTDAGQTNGMWDEMARNLLSDTQLSVSDERSVLAKVNSFCTLLQQDSSTLANKIEERGGSSTLEASEKQVPAAEGEPVSGGKPSAGIPRIDSFGELLMHLPRIASFPTFLADIYEE